MIESNEINAKDEMNKSIAVLEARIEYIIKNTNNDENFTEEELNALSFSIRSLKNWRDDYVTTLIPEIARQQIWFKQVKQLKE